MFVLVFACVFSGCEFDVDTGMQSNKELVYTLVGEGEDAYYIVGKVKNVEELGMDYATADALEYEEKALKLGVYGGEEEVVTVPAEYNGLPVKGVGAYAFYLCEAKEIILPETVEFISKNAFKNCTSLKNVKVGNNEKGSALVELGDNAFYGCGALSVVYLMGDTPPAVSSLSSKEKTNPFEATSTPVVVVKNEIRQTFVEDAKWATYKDYVVAEAGVYVDGQIVNAENTLVKYAGEGSVVEVLDFVKTIGTSAFKNTAIEKVFLPITLEEIGRQAFYCCDKLTNVTFAKNCELVLIGNSAFEGCSALTSVVIPEKVKTIKDKAFFDCSSLDTVFINAKGIENVFTYAFDKTSLESVYFIGIEQEFASIRIFTGNEKLLNATFYWNYLEENIEEVQ